MADENLVDELVDTKVVATATAAMATGDKAGDADDKGVSTLVTDAAKDDGKEGAERYRKPREWHEDNKDAEKDECAVARHG